MRKVDYYRPIQKKNVLKNIMFRFFLSVLNFVYCAFISVVTFVDIKCDWCQNPRLPQCHTPVCVFSTSVNTMAIIDDWSQFKFHTNEHVQVHSVNGLSLSRIEVLNYRIFVRFSIDEKSNKTQKTPHLRSIYVPHQLNSEDNELTSK